MSHTDGETMHICISGLEELNHPKTQEMSDIIHDLKNVHETYHPIAKHLRFGKLYWYTDTEDAEELATYLETMAATIRKSAAHLLTEEQKSHQKPCNYLEFETECKTPAWCCTASSPGEGKQCTPQCLSITSNPEHHNPGARV